MFKYITLILFIFSINLVSSQASVSETTKDTLFIIFNNDKKFQLYDTDISNLKNIQNKKNSFYFNFSNEFDFFNAILFSKCKPEKLLCVSKKKFRYYKNKAFSYSDLKKLGYQEIDSLFYMKKIFFVDKKNIGLFKVKLFEVKYTDLRKPTIE